MGAAQVQEDAGATAGELVGDAVKEGPLLAPAGRAAARFALPLVVSEQEINDALNMFEEAVAKHDW